jgi:hypothetical protein
VVQPFTLAFQPGVQRDGTRFDATRALDTLWCRFRLGRPRKMGGLQSITNTLNGLPRKVHCWYNGANIFAHVGTTNGIQQVVFDTFGNLVGVNDRTPVGYTGGPDAAVTFDALFDTTSDVVQLVGHAAPNSGFVANDISTVPFLGAIDATTPLTQFSNPGVITSGVWTQPDISGGICCVQPFVFDFDSKGLVQWSAPNLALYLGVVGGETGAGQARISSQKVVQGMALRGGGLQSPAAIFWTLSEVIVATYVGTPVWFAFNTISPSSSILSGASAIEYDGLYFWAGIDRFLVFNGTVTEVPNPQNQDWFFDNLTPGFESQTFAFKIPRYGEIWWCACMFGATVPSHAIVYNLRENAWYDTALPVKAFGAGMFAQGFKRPLAAGQDNDGLYKLWTMETGTDKVDGSQIAPLRSYFDSALFGGPKTDPPDDRGMSIQEMEPDFIQTGDMMVNLVGAPNARAAETPGPSVPLVQTPGVPAEEFVSFTPTQSQRLTRIHIESNVIGGSYIAGRNLVRGTTAERRVKS